MNIHAEAVTNPLKLFISILAKRIKLSSYERNLFDAVRAVQVAKPYEDIDWAKVAADMACRSWHQVITIIFPYDRQN